MKYRFLLVGDRFWGDDSSSAELVANLSLASYPSLPLSFSILSSARNTLEHLFQNCSRDIIGRQAGTTLLLVGWEDIQSKATEQQIEFQFENLIREIQHNSQTRILLCTHPSFQFHSDSRIGQKIRYLNECCRKMGKSMGFQIIDLESLFEEYQEKQRVRGDLMRNLFADDGSLGNLGRMLAAMSITRFLEIQ